MNRLSKIDVFKHIVKDKLKCNIMYFLYGWSYAACIESAQGCRTIHLDRHKYVWSSQNAAVTINFNEHVVFPCDCVLNKLNSVVYAPVLDFSNKSCKKYATAYEFVFDKLIELSKTQDLYIYDSAWITHTLFIPQNSTFEGLAMEMDLEI